MPKYRGRVDCFYNPDIRGRTNIVASDPLYSDAFFVNEAFSNIIQHISSSGPDLGIEMIAANYGAGSTDGFNFWDEGNRTGERAWACFRFHSASLGKFDCLIFQATSSAGTTGGPAVGGSTTVPAGGFLGMSFACHPSGSNVSQTDGPWNGTYSLTSASLGNPIWKVNSQGKGAFFPRHNGINGTFSGSRNFMATCSEASFSTEPGSTHLVISEDSLTFVSTLFTLNDTLDGNDVAQFPEYFVLHFGSFLPRAGLTHDSPYAMFTKASSTVTIVNLRTTSSIGNTGTVTVGGIAHPNLASGSRNYINNCLALTGSNFAYVGYNSFVSAGKGGFERFPLWATMYEAPNDYGILGVMNHIAVSLGPPANSVSQVSGALSYIAIGNASANSATGLSGPGVMLMIPWSGPSYGTYAGVRNRKGRTFSIG